MSKKVEPKLGLIKNNKDDNYAQQFKIANAHFEAAAEAELPVQIACAGLVLTFGERDAVELLRKLAKFCAKKETEYLNKQSKS